MLPEIGILVEFFRVDHLVANRLVSENTANAADAGDLLERKARLVETAWVRDGLGRRACRNPSGK